MNNAADQTRRQSDVMDPARANAAMAALGLSRTIRSGDALLPFFHYLYFWDAQSPDNLGRDGHPKVGGLIPDMGLPRRMWAGGQLDFLSPLRAGVPAEKVTQVHREAQKEGRTGPLGFVTLRHDILQNGELCVREFQDLVYRTDPDPDAPRPVALAARTDEVGADPLSFDTTLLFRYSALTFNGHRIHYDETYARSVEGYDGLVVHGPLLAQLMMLKAESLLGGLHSFEFRATAPLVHHRRAELCWDSNGALWIRGENGEQHMTASAT